MIQSHLGFSGDTDWLGALLQRLLRFTSVVAVVGLGGMSPASDVPGASSPARFVSCALPPTIEHGWWLPTQSPSLSAGEGIFARAYEHLSLEATTAARVLRGLHSHADLAEVRAYISDVDSVLSAAPDELDEIHATRFAQGLQSARVQLANSASSFTLWMKVAQLVSPDADNHRVPMHFVRREEPTLAEPLVIDDSRFDTRQAVRRFLGENADPPSGLA